MKHFIILILGLFLFVKSTCQERDFYIKISRQSLTFSELFDEIHRQTGIRVFCNSDSICSANLSFTADSVEVFSSLSSTIKAYGWNASWWNGNILVTTNPVVFSELPKLFEESSQSAVSHSEEAKLTETEQRYLKGRSADVIETITIGSPSLQAGKSKAKVTGRLRDENSGETLIGATVFVDELGIGTSTDANGFFTLSLDPGLYNVQLNCMGQKTAKYQLKVLSSGEFSVNLERSILQLEEVHIYADKSANIVLRDAGFERISINTLKELPMMMGERDVIKAAELLPGIVSIGEGASGINVRGGNSDQNGFYINKVPIYNTSHMFGFFPAFNPDVIKDFSIYKGHMPAEYGGRLSSVFNILTKQGNRKRFNVRGGINPVTSISRYDPFYGTPDIVFSFDQFIDLLSVKEYFHELIPVTIRERKGVTSFRVQGNSPELSIYDPLVLIDNIVVDNPQRILAANPSLLSHIEIISKPYYKGSMVYGGIISFFTKKGDFAGIELSPSDMFIKYKFFAEQKNGEQLMVIDERIPDTRNTILWISDIEFNQGESSSIKFQTPDTKGVYTILLRGLTSNGETLLIRRTFTVE